MCTSGCVLTLFPALDFRVPAERISDEASRDRQRAGSHQEVYGPSIFEVLFEGYRGDGQGKQQEGHREYDEACSLNRPGIRIAFPEKRVNGSSTLASVVPQDRLLLRVNLCADLFEGLAGLGIHDWSFA